MLKKLLFLFCFYSFNLYSQSFQSLVCSTGNVSNSFVYYNLGETITTTFSQSTLILTQGFIQPHDSSSVIMLSSNEKNEENIEVITFPNPFSNNITLQIKNSEPQNSSIQIIDILGRAMPVSFQSEQSGSMSQSYFINTSFIQSGNYFIRIVNQNKLVKVIKIIKL
jgi:hypothetical protein